MVLWLFCVRIHGIKVIHILSTPPVDNDVDNFLTCG
jgi:hypothetical protein